MAKFEDFLLSFPLEKEDADDLIKRFNALKESQKAFLLGNPRMFQSISKIEDYINAREDQSIKKNKTTITKSSTSKSVNQDSEIISELRQLNKKVNTIESIMVFFLWITILSIIGWLFALWL